MATQKVPKLCFTKLTCYGNSQSLKKREDVSTYIAYMLLMFHQKCISLHTIRRHHGLLVFYTNLHHGQKKTQVMKHYSFQHPFLLLHWYDNINNLCAFKYVFVTIYTTLCMRVDFPKSQILHYLHIDASQL